MDLQGIEDRFKAVHEEYLRVPESLSSESFWGTLFSQLSGRTELQKRLEPIREGYRNLFDLKPKDSGNSRSMHVTLGKNDSGKFEATVNSNEAWQDGQSRIDYYTVSVSHIGYGVTGDTLICSGEFCHPHAVDYESLVSSEQTLIMLQEAAANPELNPNLQSDASIEA